MQRQDRGGNHKNRMMSYDLSVVWQTAGRESVSMQGWFDVGLPCDNAHCGYGVGRYPQRLAGVWGGEGCRPGALLDQISGYGACLNVNGRPKSWGKGRNEGWDCHIRGGPRCGQRGGCGALTRKTPCCTWGNSASWRAVKSDSLKISRSAPKE